MRDEEGMRGVVESSSVVWLSASSFMHTQMIGTLNDQPINKATVDKNLVKSRLI